jgi:pyruvate kinase
MVSQISKPSTETINLSTPQGLLSTLQELRQTVESEGKAIFDKWNPHIQRTAFIDSALNLAEYLALRQHDLRPLQAALMPWGLSSLGRIEGRVMPNLDAVIATLEVICGSKSDRHFQRPPIKFFFEGDSRLAVRFPVFSIY